MERQMPPHRTNVGITPPLNRAACSGVRVALTVFPATFRVHVIRAVQHRRVGLASARWVSAAVEAESDGSAESQPGVRKFGQ